ERLRAAGLIAPVLLLIEAVGGGDQGALLTRRAGGARLRPGVRIQAIREIRVRLGQVDVAVRRRPAHGRIQGHALLLTRAPEAVCPRLTRWSDPVTEQDHPDVFRLV